MKKLKTLIAGMSILAAALAFTSCGGDGYSYSTGSVYSFPGIVAVFENGYETETFAKFDREYYIADSSLQQYTIDTDNLKGTISWKEAYTDSSFKNKITSYKDYMTIEEYKEYYDDDGTKEYGDVEQEGRTSVLYVYVKDSDLTVKASKATLNLYNASNTFLLSKEKEFESSETFASKLEDYADSTHYYTKLYTDKDMSSEVEFPLSIKDLFCNNFKFYTTLNECSDKSYFTFTEYFGVKLSDTIPSTVTDIIVPPPSYFGSDDKKETCIYDFRSKYLESITFADGYTEIWDYAFDGNTSLESVSGIDSVTKIEAGLNTTMGAFRNCTSLKEISLPAIQEIGVGAFYGCTALTSIDLPKTVSEIDEYGLSATSTINYAGTMAQWKSRVTLYFYSSSEASYVEATTDERDKLTLFNTYACRSLKSGVTVKCSDGNITY